MKYIEIEETYVYNIYKNSGFSYELPHIRNVEKDIEEYMMLMHAKLEFLQDAMERNIWNSTHFAWIDFNISHIFKYNKENTLKFLTFLSIQKLSPSFLVIPGCTQKYDISDTWGIYNTVQWRFCGGFLIGDKNSIMDFCVKYREHLPEFIKENRKIVWEVNIWSWLESIKCVFQPQWYLADHNDSIIYIPTDLYATPLCLEPSYKKTVYEYPIIDGDSVRYQPSSSSYLYHKGEHLINTRYVSYTLFPCGTYFFTVLLNHNGDCNKIYNKNILSKLDSELHPISYSEISENRIDIPSKTDCFSFGLEDLRLYSFDENTVKFIASTISYSPTDNIRIMTGIYNIETLQFSDCRIIEPPTQTHCEKNWVPIVKDGEEYFIYQWSPFEIGKINENGKLEIVYRKIIFGANLHRARGSSIFHETNDGLVGIVHFCEEGKPRHYYHMLILLDKETMFPIKYSNPFYFNNVSIEFCIGMSIMDEKYHFWISQMDGSPEYISVSINSKALDNSFTADEFEETNH
jgi:hypothetical protein